MLWPFNPHNWLVIIDLQIQNSTNMKQIQLIIIFSICGLAFSQCKKQTVVEESPEEVDPMTIIDSVTTASQNIKLNGYQAQCFENKISSLDEKEPFTINDSQTYKNYFGCQDGDLPAIDFSKQTLLIANIPRNSIPGFWIKQSIENENGHFHWIVKFPSAYGSTAIPSLRRQVCYVYNGVIRKENITLIIGKYNN
ncbi:hypothetical protein BWI93_04670 [Siphonobacter sp. BAB-5385]|uniref:hypothetical protein n=1 Tax=Siphonobacter sp. BAB-5385 TaxID=1864822 RepID=UPI000B9DE36B|nr:hypothetical protein [Siphonobacter sp. BAB-5385]OZI09322.1 hypothetical protein BWI93_04670 [Siphonobacter sp. BAB-5385]